MHQVYDIRPRVRAATALPDLLAAAFDAFEVIRLLARANEDRVPGLFAAFMATASAAVDGREAVTIAPSLPPGLSNVSAGSQATAHAGIDELTIALGALGALLNERLTLAAHHALVPGDREACIEAAGAAGRIRGFMAGDGDASLW